ncbi:carbamoyltransferase [Aureococcus anophagefferens]|nr:carbamoyltransferase [Aureococcus anophagefferens]
MWVLLAALTAVSALHAPRSVVLGLNKYSHNACVAVADAHTGELLFAQEKERLTRVKNDGGAVGDLVRHALAACDVGIDDVVAVVANDHHRCRTTSRTRSARPRPATGSGPPSSVMDGMGERRRFDEADFHSDADLPGFGDCVHVLNDARVDFGAVPPDAECETAYAEARTALSPLVKRWCLGVPGAFFGFGDWFAAPMDSLGAAYSHVSHVVFGDWNARRESHGPRALGRPGDDGRRDLGRPDARLLGAVRAKRRRGPGRRRPALRRADAGVSIDRSAIADLLARAAAALPDAAFVGDAAAFRAAFLPASPTNLWKFPSEPVAAARARRLLCAKDLEAVASPSRPTPRPGAGRDARRALRRRGPQQRAQRPLEEEAAARVHVPSAPGDEGCALGCAARALAVAGATKHLNTALLPYGGAAPSDDEIDDASTTSGEWLEAADGVADGDDGALVARCAAALAANDGAAGVVFWFEGRGEFGPRALGHRSIVAPATRYDVVDGINDVVKGREDFRPLAPAVLEEEASKCCGAALPRRRGRWVVPGAAVPARKHARYALTTTVERGDDGEPGKHRRSASSTSTSPSRTRRDEARRRRTPTLDAAIYERCDGELSAAELAADLVADLDEDESDPVSEADVYLRLARLWRLTLVRLG